jgi:hypothetical protein
MQQPGSLVPACHVWSCQQMLTLPQLPPPEVPWHVAPTTSHRAPSGAFAHVTHPSPPTQPSQAVVDVPSMLHILGVAPQKAPPSTIGGGTVEMQVKATTQTPVLYWHSRPSIGHAVAWSGVVSGHPASEPVSVVGGGT